MSLSTITFLYNITIFVIVSQCLIYQCYLPGFHYGMNNLNEMTYYFEDSSVRASLESLGIIRSPIFAINFVALMYHLISLGFRISSLKTRQVN